MRPAPRNAITDVAGLRVGHATDEAALTGVTVLLGNAPFVASCSVMGAAPGTRETDLLAPSATVDAVDAIVLAGGSAWGLAAADGVMGALHADGGGFRAGDHRIPIVPAAILFDLGSGRSGANFPALGRAAYEAAAPDFQQGSVGAGTGATTATVKGGIGTASCMVDDMTVGALVAVNPVGTVCHPETGRFWAAPFELNGEFGGLGLPDPSENLSVKVSTPRTATTLAIIATDARLTKAQAQRLAVVAHDGMARAILPSHTAFDGDIVFALSTGTGATPDPATMTALGHAAACCMARAIARGVHSAQTLPGDIVPSWQDRWGEG